MKITTVKPEPPPMKVIIEMTEDEVFTLRNWIDLKHISKEAHPVPHKFFTLINDFVRNR